MSCHVDPKLEQVYEKLKEIRKREDLKAKPSQHLKTTFEGFDGVERPLVLRPYQIKGIAHLMAMPRFLLGDDTGCGKCKPLNSLVLTTKGLVKLGTLAPQQEMSEDQFYKMPTPILVHTGLQGWAPIKSYYNGGVKSTLQVQTRRGYTTEGSFVHPLWARTEKGESFLQLKALQIGDYVCLARGVGGFPDVEPTLPLPDTETMHALTKVYAVPTQLTPDLARLLGYIIAEAWTKSRTFLPITQHLESNPEVYQDIHALCLSVLNKVSTGNAEDKKTLTISSVYLRAYLQGLGIDAVLSAEKTVPWPIFLGTRDSVVGFLRGYFDGEASMSGDSLEVASASKQLLQEVQQLLLRLGIIASRRPKVVKGKTYWRITITGQDVCLFQDSVGLLRPDKQAALAKLASKTRNTNLDIIPHTREVIGTLREEIRKATCMTGANANRKGSGIKQFGIAFEKALNNIQNCGRNPSYTFLSKLLEIARQVGATNNPAYGDLFSILDRHFYYDVVTSIDESSCPVADLEVEDALHSFVADGFINHNTIQGISALSYLWDKEPNQKAIVLTTKSAVHQWRDEFRKFAVPSINLITVQGTPVQRKKQYAEFEAATGPTVLIMGYRAAVQDFTLMQKYMSYILMLDEATAFKTPGTQIFQVVQNLSKRASRVWGFSATLIKNHLMEGYGIYQVIVPGLFPTNKNKFMVEYCVIKMQSIRGSNRQIPIIVGYRPEDIKKFKEVIDPFYIGRPKHEVATELPALTVRQVEVALTIEQSAKYAEALSGLLTLGEGLKSEERETTELTQLIYCQQIVNDLDLIGVSGSESPKLEKLWELLDEGDFAEDKVIVFSRFKKMVNIAEAYLKGKGVECVRVTGDEDTQQRRDAAKRFQDPNDPVRVCFITQAGAEAINLQAARALIFYDSPWSAGDMLQILGRMIRIGSTHDNVYALHLVASGTIDEHVLRILKKKLNLIEDVLGQRLKTTDTIDVDPDAPVKEEPLMITVKSDMKELFNSMLESAREK